MEERENFLGVLFPGRRTRPAFLSGAIIVRPYGTFEMSLREGLFCGPCEVWEEGITDLKFQISEFGRLDGSDDSDESTGAEMQSRDGGDGKDEREMKGAARTE